jgi:hypothetical protein
MPSITETSLQELLPEYYKRLFPHYLMCKWLGYSEGKVSTLQKSILSTKKFILINT